MALIAVGISAAAPAQQAHVSHAQAVARARQIVAKMTLDEKIGSLHGVHDTTRYRMVPGVPRLGIPDFWMTNGPAGRGAGRRESAAAGHRDARADSARSLVGSGVGADLWKDRGGRDAVAGQPAL